MGLVWGRVEQVKGRDVSSSIEGQKKIHVPPHMSAVSCSMGLVSDRKRQVLICPQVVIVAIFLLVDC